jgi:O-antigen ligase
MAVHLGAVAVFLVLGLQHTHPPNRARSRWDWMWWGLWVPSVVIAASTSRGGFLAVVCAFSVVLAFRPRSRWWKPAIVTTVLGGAFFMSNVSIDVGLPRKISAQQLVANILSIHDSKQDLTLSGTREWRLEWWGDIVNYTVFGKYRWTGKGFGVNLADDDGYQFGNKDYVPNRSPHNVQMTILARAGVPGILLWVALQAAFVLTLVNAYRRARRAGWDWWARVDLWILAYWIAILVNGTFDVYLEGPPGGIWYWCIFGFGIAAVQVQRRLPARSPFEATAGGNAIPLSSRAATWP